MSKKTIIIGASPNPARYSFLAAEMLQDHGHEFVPLALKKGSVLGFEIIDIRSKPVLSNVDTVTLYVGPQRQPDWYEYILSMKPKRLIFNPGTENPEFASLAEAAGVSAIEACTLVMLRTGQY